MRRMKNINFRSILTPQIPSSLSDSSKFRTQESITITLRFSRNNSHLFPPVLAVDAPLLYLAVGRAGVVDEATVAAHPVAVDHQAPLELQAVVVRVVYVHRVHTRLELPLRHHLAYVLQDVRAYRRGYQLVMLLETRNKASLYIY